MKIMNKRKYPPSPEIETIERLMKKRDDLQEENKRLRGLLRRANMALLCYTQSHDTPHTQLMDEMAEELGLDADGNTLKELAEELSNEQ